MHVLHCYHSATLHTGAYTHEKVNAEVACDVPHGFNPVPMAAVSVSLESCIMCYDHCYFSVRDVSVSCMTSCSLYVVWSSLPHVPLFNTLCSM